jgi:hypothetical protein
VVSVFGLYAGTTGLALKPFAGPTDPYESTHPNRNFRGKPLPSPCHPGAPEERSGASAVFPPAIDLEEGTTLPFVISTEAKRSGEICGYSSLEMFS